MKPEPWQINAAGPFPTIDEVWVWTLGGHRLCVEIPDGAREVEGIDRARELAHRLGCD
jgi:hypothetical protein